MTDLPVFTIRDQVTAFAEDLRGSFQKKESNEAVQSIFKALAADDWNKVLELLRMFKTEGSGAVSDQANWLIGEIEKADDLVLA